ncbi:MAG: hypothetical protein JFR41_07440 [Muribaculaceae bacterium]|nr:hypothetical protein [Muribaculaceae bacterium]
MISEKTKRNIFGSLAVVGLFVIAGRSIDLVMGDGTWWSLAGACILYGCVSDRYLYYRRRCKKK